MERLLTIFIIIMAVLSAFVGTRSLVDWKNNKEYSALNSFVTHCSAPVQNEFINGGYRYYCDADSYTSNLSPEKYQQLKDN